MKLAKIRGVALCSKSESRAWHLEALYLSERDERVKKVDGACFEARIEENNFLCCRVYELFAIRIRHVRLEKVLILHEVLVSSIFTFKPTFTVINALFNIKVWT